MPLNCCEAKKNSLEKCLTAKRNAQQERWPWNKNKRRIIQYKHQTSQNKLIMWSELQAKIPTKLDVAKKCNVFATISFHTLIYLLLRVFKCSRNIFSILSIDFTWTHYDSTKMHFFFLFNSGFPYRQVR